MVREFERAPGERAEKTLLAIKEFESYLEENRENDCKRNVVSDNEANKSQRDHQ